MGFSKGQMEVLDAMKTGILQAMQEGFRTNNEYLRQEIQDSARNTQELLMQEIKASEHRVKTELRQEFRQELEATKEGIIDFIDDALLPQIDALSVRVRKLETKVA